MVHLRRTELPQIDRDRYGIDTCVWNDREEIARDFCFP